MTGDPCAEMQLLIQAELDGELAAGETARLQTHLHGCVACASMHRDLLDLSLRLRADAPRHRAPLALRAKLARGLVEVPPRRAWWSRGALGNAGAFGAGAALAACLLLVVLPRGEALSDAVVAAHIRALQPGHLIDVVSTDRHTVKPWFDGRLPFAPPVKDFAAAGFPLAGGRLDFLRGRTAASLVYRAGPHLIDVFVWPESGPAPDEKGVRDGYNFVRWSAGGMAFWAVSDLNPAELAMFVRLWRMD